MALLEGLVKRDTLTALAVGAGPTILAPIVLPAVAQNVRPAAKVTVKGASCHFERGGEVVADCRKGGELPA